MRAARDRGPSRGPSPFGAALAGDGEAAREIAALLDDSDVVFRRKAAEVLFESRRAEAAPQLRLALSRDDDAWFAAGARWRSRGSGKGRGARRELLDDRRP